MYKQIISSILVVSLLNLAGCYSYQEITKDDFSQTEDQSDLLVITKNQDWYKFDEGYYTVTKDSIYGSGKLKPKTSKDKYIDYSGSVYLKDIETLKMDEFDLTSTILAVAIPVGLFLLIGYLQLKEKFGN